MKIHSYYFSAHKRIFDLATSAILLILSSPLLLLVGIILWLTIGQPIIFKQHRTGQNGKTFNLYKFRTMKKNALMLKPQYQHLNEAPLPMFKIHNDPRYVGPGKWLAHTGIDELPQLWNIFKGEMSFVGPRPLPVSEADHLPIEWQQWRVRVKSGIFSQWALSEKKHSTLSNWENLEQKTLSKGGLTYDLAIIQKTVFSTLSELIKLSSPKNQE